MVLTSVIYIFSGAKASTLQYCFLVGITSVRRIIKETCRAINKVFKKKYLKVCIGLLSAIVIGFLPPVEMELLYCDTYALEYIL